MKRREFLTIPAAALGGTLLYTLAREPFRLQAQDGVVESSTAVLHGRGGARDRGGVRANLPERRHWTGRERSRRGDLHRPAIGRSLWRRQISLHQGTVRGIGSRAWLSGKENPRETYHQGIAKLGTNFDELPVDEQIQKLQAMEKTHFFQLLRAHTIEGMFSDPMHGGNAGLIGWQLVGYPGPRMNYKEDIDQHFGAEWRPKPAGLEQIMKRKGNPWEDDKA